MEVVQQKFAVCPSTDFACWVSCFFQCGVVVLWIYNHGHIQNWVFDFFITMTIGQNWVFEFLIIMIIGWNWVFDFFENQNNQSLRIILIPSAGLLQFLIPTQHWFLHGFTLKAKEFLKFQYVGC